MPSRIGPGGRCDVCPGGMMPMPNLCATKHAILGALERDIWQGSFGGDGVVERLIAALKKLKENTNSCPEALSQRIGFEFDSSKARKEVYKILGTILGLSKAQKFDVSEIILGKAKHVDIFLALPEEDHPNLIGDFEGPAVFAVPELLAGPEDHVRNQPKTYFH
ncbi:hypothetical protein SASPL_156575 [Salvia splendens]|uniref:Uncharacterized protein n=1 Tax=Salvia splendens TaxID=180675 RepID=A0A8X8VWE4_SALSN|nr:hypothetical protein SASPL_156575 [Salvia splendens]